MSDYKIAQNNGFTYIPVITDIFSKCTWCVPMKNKYGQTITHEISNIIKTSKRKPLREKSDRGADFHDETIHNFSKFNKIHRSSRYTDKGRSMSERVIRAIHNLRKGTGF